ncbi:MAG: LytTR family DNA-binding domain-containing protein [Spirochaetia bacterium]|nr:LytTR family DNA-binding domain-containing protein [Spirochaetia bacterium]
MRVLILEDEPVHSRYLTTLLKELPDLDLESVSCQKTLTGAECHLLDAPVDLLFLDLNVCGENGFDLLGSFAGAAFSTVVVSAHTERAIEAYDYGVLDFLPKPVTRDRLVTALDRFKHNRYSSRHTLKYFSIFDDGILETLLLSKILYFEASGRKLIIHMTDGSKKYANRKIGDLVQLLPPTFQLIHRSFMVNIESVSSLRGSPGGKYRLALSNGTELPVSRRLYQTLKTQLLNGITN